MKRYTLGPNSPRGCAILADGDPFALVHGETRGEAIENAARIIWLLERDDEAHAYAEAINQPSAGQRDS